MRYFVCCCLVIVFSLALAIEQIYSQEDSFVIKISEIHTAAGPIIKNGSILVRNGKIVSVGTNIQVPNGTRVIDHSGKVVTPGFIDTHSHVGIFDSGDANEEPMPYGSENRAIDAIRIESPLWQEAVKGGTTVIVTGPGSGERMGGQSITIKTFGKDLQKRILKESGELKMAVNANDFTYIPEIRSKFYKALEYIKSIDKYESGDKSGTPPKRDLTLEALARGLKKEVPVRVHALYAHDMMSFLEMQDEFGFELQFIHSDGAYKIVDELAKRDVACICNPLAFHVGVSEEVIRGNVLLHNAGVKIAMHSDHPVSLQKTFRLCGSLSIRYGLSADTALKTLTIYAAEIAKMEDRIGSIESGKDADLVVLDGPWYELSTRVEMVFVDGIIAYDRSKEEKHAGEDR